MLRPQAHRHVDALKDTGGPQSLLGCANCADRALCGELHLQNTGAPILSCMEHCTCADPGKCDVVCPTNAPDFVRRFHEVDGWDLKTIPRAREVPMPSLPDWIPLIHGNLSGPRSLDEPTVALPLTYALIGAGKTVRGRTAAELRRAYGARPSQGWVLSGTEGDPSVERIWSLPDLSRVARQLRHAGAVMATTPNFSLMVDTPRHDNFHAMKRIAWAWFRMTQGGLCTALHLNARTDHDFDRWTHFVRSRPEINAVAFEFLTGSATNASAQLYAERLRHFAKGIGRPISLIMRGRADLKAQLAEAFQQVVLLDASPYMRATKRRKAFVGASGTLSHAFTPTVVASQARALLLHNIHIHRTHVTESNSADRVARQQELDLRARPPDVHAHDESRQISLFPNQAVDV